MKFLIFISILMVASIGFIQAQGIGNAMVFSGEAQLPQPPAAPIEPRKNIVDHSILGR